MSCLDAGAAAGVQHGPAGGGGEDPFQELDRVRRTGPVVACGVHAERLGGVTEVMSGHAPTLVGKCPLGKAVRCVCWSTQKGSPVPTGVALRDVRRQLFEAADRILLRDGPSGLTSRAVTTEAGCAKGVLHRHFEDFDAFLADFVLDRVEQLAPEAAALVSKAGTGTVAGNVTEALTAVFGSVAVAIVALIAFRDGLRARLRHTWPAGVPVLTEAAEMIGAYLAAERERGRVPVGADPDVLAAMLIGTGHMLFADRTGAPPTEEALHRMVSSVLRHGSV